jgi:AcrR family transcriptional regulator
MTRGRDRLRPAMSAERSDQPIWMRPERARAGRPAQRSRAEITAVAIAIADAEGLDAVSMRRVAADLGTGAASLYRYVETREDLLDLMADATGAEQSFAPPSGDWLTDLVAVGEQTRAIMRRHRWLAGLIATRPMVGPHGVVLIEHVLEILADHPADVPAKLEAFAMLTSITAAFVQHEVAGGRTVQQRNTAYLIHAVTSGAHPRLGELLAAGAPTPADPADRYPDILRKVLTGLLGP